MSAYTDATARFYESRLNRIAEGLRSMADQVERDGTPSATASFTGAPRYANSAAQVLHVVTWGIANLHIDNLITDAAQADQAEAEDGAA